MKSMDAATVTVSAERLARVSHVLGALSIGEIDLAKLHIEVDDEDAFAPFEEMFNVFMEEFAATKMQNDELLQARLETIERQQAAIADLSVPVIEVWDDIVMLPVVGIVDTQRSVEMTQRLLQRVAHGGARCVIVDLTGIDVVDTSAADHLIRMMRSVQLLGSLCVLSGISPTIAQTLVQLDVELAEVEIVRNLKDGLTLCFKHLDSRRRARGT